jgi:hypothetical protein
MRRAHGTTRPATPIGVIAEVEGSRSASAPWRVEEETSSLEKMPYLRGPSSSRQRERGCRRSVDRCSIADRPALRLPNDPAAVGVQALILPRSFPVRHGFPPPRMTTSTDEVAGCVFGGSLHVPRPRRSSARAARTGVTP